MFSSRKYLSALCCSTILMLPSMAFAQDIAAPEDVNNEETVIVVTGSQIQGSKINDILPVTVLDETAIEATGAISGEELFAAIPQIGTTAFNEQNQTGGVNGARGDIASINLRDLGTGNTLLLINGRRANLNPGFQTELLVPVVSSDSNEIAPGSIRRLEILRDGASAIYGADAVAGVVNTILKGDLSGGFLEGEWRASDGTGLFSVNVSGGYGFDFADGRGNFTVYGNYFHENGLDASAREFSRTEDRLALLVGTDFEGDAQFNNLSLSTPFGQFDIQAPNNATPIRDDDFFLIPTTLGPLTAGGCRLDFGNGLCATNGTVPITASRFNTLSGTSLFSEKNRYNVSALFDYELTDNVEFYIEGSYYRSENSRFNEPSALLAAVPVGVSRNAFFNPFGPTTRNGQPNPNRLPGTTIAAGGADIIIERFRFVDVGTRQVTVDKDSYRLVSGFRGSFGDWDYDTGFLYSQANSTDLERGRISLTLLQNAINRTTPDAFNVFNGGNLIDPSQGDSTPNPQSVIDDVTVDVFRKGETTLALADFKVSRNNLFTLPGGDVGIAAGVEFRRETFFDDRDPRLDGTITFTDTVTGAFNGSDVVQSSPTPDTSGNREVYSGFAELLIPLVSEDLNIPLIKSFNVQLAGRFEHFSDINQTATVPRAAVSWVPLNGILLRGAWSRGFRAPNLVQVNDAGTTRSNTRDDFVICQAQVEQNIIANLGVCAGQGTISFRSGSNELEPEGTESINLGLVLEPSFIRGLTLTGDYWRVRQDGIVGVFGDDNAIALDLLLRQNGSFNPNVQREAPDADDIALFAGTSLDPVGNIIQVLDPYFNLDGRISSGVDFGLLYNLPDFGLGDFRLRLNAARLISFVQNAGPQGQQLLDAIAAGALPADVAVDGLGELLEIEGRPKWRLSGSLNWRSGGFNGTLFGRYVGSVFDTSVVRDTLIVSDDPNANFFEVEDQFTLNAFMSYTITDDSAINGTRIKFGVNNIFNVEPPLADETFGFFSELHSARGRQFIFEISKSF